MVPAARSRRDDLDHQCVFNETETGSTTSTSHRRGGPKQAPHHNSKQLQDCLNPVRGIRDALRRQGIEPVNHAAHNAAAIKAASKANRTRREQQQQQQLEQARAARRPSSAASVRSSGYGTPAYTPSRRPSGMVSGADDAEARSESGRSACTSRATREQGPPVFKPFRRGTDITDKGEAWLRKQDYGRVPQYILERKLSMAAQYAEELAQKEAALVPPGMRVLPEEERQEMLALLALSRAEEEEKLLVLPFVIKTERHRRYKAEVEARLAEIQEAVQMFSQLRVLVEL